MSKLADEITNDPLGRGYSGMNDAEVAADLNTEYRTRNRSSLSGDVMFQQTVPSEFQALSDTLKDRWLTFTRIDAIDPFAQANEQFVVDIFGDANNSSTTANLVDARTETVSRAVEIGLGTVREGDVKRVRT